MSRFDNLILKDFGPELYAGHLQSMGSDVEVIANKETTLKCGTCAFRTDIEWTYNDYLQVTSLVVSSYRNNKCVYLVAHAGPNPEKYAAIVESREELCRVNDEYAAEHVQVLYQDLDWWVKNLKSYGSLFLGEGSTVPHGDKCSGTNHILPTKKAGYYSGGLNVHKFLKIYTYQEISKEANLTLSAAASP